MKKPLLTEQHEAICAVLDSAKTLKTCTDETLEEANAELNLALWKCAHVKKRYEQFAKEMEQAAMRARGEIR
jgi:hypothetical protein